MWSCHYSALIKLYNYISNLDLYYYISLSINYYFTIDNNNNNNNISIKCTVYIVHCTVYRVQTFVPDDEG